MENKLSVNGLLEERVPEIRSAAQLGAVHHCCREGAADEDSSGAGDHCHSGCPAPTVIQWGNPVPLPCHSLFHPLLPPVLTFSDIIVRESFKLVAKFGESSFSLTILLLEAG